MLDALLGVASGLAGHFMNKKAADKQAAANEAARQQDYAHQKEFAQSGVQWKVDDARRAGIHPAVALGASTASFSPIGVGDTGSQYLAASGQDLSRAIDSTRTATSRISAFDRTVQALTVQKMGLENELLSSQIMKTKQQVGPPMAPLHPDAYNVPGQSASGVSGPALMLPAHQTMNPQFTPNLKMFGKDWMSSGKWSDAQSFEDRYGEGADWASGVPSFISDWYYNMGPYLEKNLYGKLRTKQ